MWLWSVSTADSSATAALPTRHSRTVSSGAAVARVWPSALKARAVIGTRCPRSTAPGRGARGLETSQSRAVPSVLVVTRISRPGWKAVA